MSITDGWMTNDHQWMQIDFKGITPRRMEILELLCDGMTYKQVGEHLGISDKTVSGLATRIYKALGANNRNEAMKIVERYNLKDSNLGQF